MSRSTKKGPFVDEKLMKKISKAKSAGGRNTVINTWVQSIYNRGRDVEFNYWCAQWKKAYTSI